MSLKGFKTQIATDQRKTKRNSLLFMKTIFRFRSKPAAKLGKKQNRFYESFSDFNSSMLYVVYIYIYMIMHKNPRAHPACI